MDTGSTPTLRSSKILDKGRFTLHDSGPNHVTLTLTGRKLRGSYILLKRGGVWQLVTSRKGEDTESANTQARRPRTRS